MVDASLFFKENAVDAETINFAPTTRFKDAEGKPLEWTLKKISTERNEEIIEDCTKGAKIDNQKYIRKLVAACVVEPNLDDAGLQDNYNVKKAEDVAPKILKYAGEWLGLVKKINDFNEFKNLDAEIEEMEN